MYQELVESSLILWDWCDLMGITVKRGCCHPTDLDWYRTPRYRHSIPQHRRFSVGTHVESHSSTAKTYLDFRVTASNNTFRDVEAAAIGAPKGGFAHGYLCVCVWAQLHRWAMRFRLSAWVTVIRHHNRAQRARKHFSWLSWRTSPLPAAAASTWKALEFLVRLNCTSLLTVARQTWIINIISFLIVRLGYGSSLLLSARIPLLLSWLWCTFNEVTPRHSACSV